MVTAIKLWVIVSNFIPNPYLIFKCREAKSLKFFKLAIEFYLSKIKKINCENKWECWTEKLPL